MANRMTQQSTNPIDKPSTGLITKLWWEHLTPFIPKVLKRSFLAFDKRVDGAASFFIKHWGKSRFMIAMSKKSQYLGIERLWYKGPKAFIYFFLFYLIRDTILYIIIPIFFASLTAS
jgi:hypothetical protein